VNNAPIVPIVKDQGDESFFSSSPPHIFNQVGQEEARSCMASVPLSADILVCMENVRLDSIENVSVASLTRPKLLCFPQQSP